MEALRNAATAFGDKIQEVFSGMSAEWNKERVKDANNTVGERVGASVDYTKDKIEESGHSASKEVHQQKATP